MFRQGPLQNRRVIVRYLIAYIIPLAINPILINLGILGYLGSSHGDIFRHNIHFLLRCINDILCTTKQTATEFFVRCDLISSKCTAATVAAKATAVKNLFFILVTLFKLNHFTQNT